MNYVTTSNMKRIAKRDGGWYCRYCGCDLVPRGEESKYLKKMDGAPGIVLMNGSIRMPQLDHVVPRASGGSNHIDNLVLSCGKCNNKKRDKSVEDYCGGLPEARHGDNQSS